MSYSNGRTAAVHIIHRIGMFLPPRCIQITLDDHIRTFHDGCMVRGNGRASAVLTVNALFGFVMTGFIQIADHNKILSLVDHDLGLEIVALCAYRGTYARWPHDTFCGIVPIRDVQYPFGYDPV